MSAALACAALLARARPVTGIPGLILAVGSPYLVAPALVGATFALATRRPMIGFVNVACAIALVAVQIPWYFFGDPPRTGSSAAVRLLSSNLREGEADAAEFVRFAERNADVVAVAELTTEAVQRFELAGMGRTFSFAHLVPRPGAAGVGLWSRFPLTKLSAPGRRAITSAAARADIPGVRLDPLLVSVHLESPVAEGRDNVANWAGGIASARTMLDYLAALAGPAAVIAGGDFNSTPDLLQYREMLTVGYRDVVEQLGAGFAPTFPADAWHPPLIVIDHILTRNAAASNIQTVAIRGSDHLGLLGTIHVPLEPGE